MQSQLHLPITSWQTDQKELAKLHAAHDPPNTLTNCEKLFQVMYLSLKSLFNEWNNFKLFDFQLFMLVDRYGWKSFPPYNLILYDGIYEHSMFTETYVTNMLLLLYLVKIAAAYQVDNGFSSYNPYTHWLLCGCPT